jgi:hypothetical protein
MQKMLTEAFMAEITPMTDLIVTQKTMARPGPATEQIVNGTPAEEMASYPLPPLLPHDGLHQPPRTRQGSTPDSASTMRRRAGTEENNG